MGLPGSLQLQGKPPETVAAKAYRALERMIVTLDLAPGSVTTEGALIEVLRLGRTPVREAVQRLAWEGLLEVRPRAGLAVAPLQRADWVKVLDARGGVEIVLATSAARGAGGPVAGRFHAAALSMERAVLNADALAFLDADKLLDEALAETSENPYAARVAAPLQTHSRRFWFRYRAEDGLARTAERHVRLIRAILDRNEAEAGREAEALIGFLRAQAIAAS